MKEFKISKKKAIENQLARAKECKAAGDVIGVIQCLAQVNAIRAFPTNEMKARAHPINE